MRIFDIRRFRVLSTLLATWFVFNAVPASRADVIGGAKTNQAPRALNAPLDDTVRNEAIHLLSQSKLKEARELVEKVRATKNDLPHTDLILADWLIQAGQAPAAVQILETLAATSPPRKDIHYSFARIALDQGRVFDAWLHVDKIQSIPFDPKWSSEYGKDFADAVRELTGQIADRRGQWQEAYEIFSSLVEQKPGNVQARFGLARSAFFLKKIDIAEEQFRLLEPVQKPPVLAETMIANLYDSINEKASCEAWFKKGLNRGDADIVRIEYGNWLLRHNRADDTIKLAQGFQSESSKWDQMMMIARAQQMQGEFQESITSLEKILQANPNHFAALIHLSWALADQQDESQRAKAKVHAAKAVDISKGIPIAMGTLAWAQYRTGEVDAAWKSLAKVPSINVPKDVVYFLARMNEGRGETKSAQAQFEAIRRAEGEFYHQLRMPQ